jgi:hypothetical protein
VYGHLQPFRWARASTVEPLLVAVPAWNSPRRCLDGVEDLAEEEFHLMMSLEDVKPALLSQYDAPPVWVANLPHPIERGHGTTRAQFALRAS